MTLEATVGTFSYQVCGITLGSDVPFPELTQTAWVQAPGDLTIRVELAGPYPPPAPPAQWFLNRSLPSGAMWLSTAKVADGYRLRFHGWADFTVDQAGRTIHGYPEPGTSADTLRHLLLDQVLPLVLTLHGRQVFHATAAQTSHGVCVFLGPAGVGKSTLAASFLAAGYPVLSDDCLVIEEAHGQWLALPAYLGLRLWEDSLAALGGDPLQSYPVADYTSKRRPVITGDRTVFPTAPQPVARFYTLVRPEGAVRLSPPIIETLSHRDAFLELLAGAHRFDITDRTTLARQFDFLARFVSTVPVRRLQLPNSFSALPWVRETILADLTEPGS